MLAQGFNIELLVDLVRAGLASAHAERMVAGGKMTEVARVKISEAGWRTLGDDAINGRAKST
jgi:5-keto 4-deoxyuronate isomerase